ncbi:hypothetical protein J9B83_06290 [Marinomonas sp. A79]|uniref:Uncharacterized protein n=1 Tax=Marinomonas vulgaris TaxID=2823372 RepID=A0ABS5HA64_9GAMM|nr:hypothetical protein [Marinomonas vulgaris]MBR7888548.1 hypothetical protein [Marinomonas vulgaris]
MTTLIVVFITLSLMGSALWILPPKKERERMALRMQARQLGLNVQLTSIDLPDKWDKSKNREKTVAYALYRLKPIETITANVWLLPYEVWKYHDVIDGWWSSEQLDASDEVKKVLSEYGDLLTGVQLTADSVTFYWREKGDALALEALSMLVHSLVEYKGKAI